MPIFFIIVLIVLTLMYTYVGRRIIHPARLRRPWKFVAWAAVYTAAALPIVPHLIRHAGVETPVIDLALGAGYVGMGFFVLLFTLIAVRDLITLLARLIVRIKRWIRLPRAANPHVKPAINADRRYRASMGTD